MVKVSVLSFAYLAGLLFLTFLMYFLLTIKFLLIIISCYLPFHVDVGEQIRV